MKSISQADILASDYQAARTEYLVAREHFIMGLARHATEGELARLAVESNRAFVASEEAKRACFGQRAMVLS